MSPGAKLIRALRRAVYYNAAGSRLLRLWFATHPLHVQGHALFLDPLDSLKLYYKRVHEEFETGLVQREIRPGHVVLDVGAHIGYFTLLMARAAGERGRVYAFEPHPGNFALLERNVKLNGYQNVVLARKAVSNEAGWATLYESGSNTGDHRLHLEGGAAPATRVETVRLDDLFRDAPPRFDFIKMDIQGAEMGALKGMEGLIRRSPGVKLLMEFWPYGLQSFGTGPAEPLLFLRGLGFRIQYRRSSKDREMVTLGDFRELLDRYPPTPAKGNFVNLFCVQGG